MNRLSWIFVAGLFVSLIVLSSLVYQHFKLTESNAVLHSEIMKSNLELGRAKTEFGNAEKYINELEDAVQKEIKKKDAAIKMAAQFEADLKIKVKGETKVEVVYLPSIPILSLKEPTFTTGSVYHATSATDLKTINSFKLSFKDRRIKIDSEVQVSMDLINPFGIGSLEYELLTSIRGTLVQVTTENGAIGHYLILHEVDENHEDIRRIPLTSFNVTVVDERKAHMQWWAPRLDLGIMGGLEFPIKYKSYGSFGFSLSGYGKKDDLSFRFVRISLEINDSIAFGFAPVLYNIGQPLVIFRNLWIGPEIFYRPGNINIISGGLFIGATL